MRLTTVLLVLCAFDAIAESQSVTVRGAPQQKSERNLLTSAISGIQHAVGAAVGGVLEAAAIQLAEKLGEKLVHHNKFAVSVLRCVVDAATQAARTAADTAEGAADASHLQGKKQHAAAAQKRGLLNEVADAVRDCVVRAMHETTQQLEQQAHKLPGNASRVVVAALEALKEAIEKNVTGNRVVLQSLQGAVDMVEQVVRNLAHKADGVIDRMAANADDLVESVARSTHTKRNFLKGVVGQIKAALAKTLAQWINNATSAAVIKAEDLIAQAEKAGDEGLEKAQQVVDDNVVEGSDLEKALEAVLKEAEGVKEQLVNNATVAVHSAAQQVADSISRS